MLDLKALVTGGAGFIGSHLAEALVRRGASVRVLDDLSTGRAANLAWVRPNDAFEFVRGDVRDPEVVRRCLMGVDQVFHLAALPSVPRSVETPVLSHDINLTATVTLLEQCRQHPVQRFVFAGSSSIYGDQAVSPKHEALSPQPLSPYALQKSSAELYGLIYARYHGVPFVSTRFFNVFGPRQAYDSPYAGVIAKFCTSALQGATPTIYGDGQQSRDFTYIDNVVGGLVRVTTASAEKVVGRAFNLACGEGTKLLQIVAELNRLTGQTSAPNFTAARPGEVQHSCADIAAAREAFGYNPLVGWAEGLARTLAWYRTVGVVAELQSSIPLAPS